MLSLECPRVRFTIQHAHVMMHFNFVRFNQEHGADRIAEFQSALLHLLRGSGLVCTRQLFDAHTNKELKRQISALAGRTF